MIIDNPNITHLALMQSNMVLAGFPILVGFFPSANRNGAEIAPAPGKRAPEVGYVESSFVARNRHEGFCR